MSLGHIEKINFEKKKKAYSINFFIQIYCGVLKQVENIYI